MQYTKKITKTIEQEVVTDVVCNLCGKSCEGGTYPGDTDADPHKDYQGLLETVVTGGYFSKRLGDSVSYKFSLCEDCLKDLFAKFKVPVEVKSDVTSGEFIPETELAEAEREHREYMKHYEQELTNSRKTE